MAGPARLPGPAVLARLAAAVLAAAVLLQLAATTAARAETEDAGDPRAAVGQVVAARVEDLLRPLEGVCVESSGSGWWQYAWCHGNEVRQFHMESRTGPRSVDWSAGTLAANGGEPTLGGWKNNRPTYIAYKFEGGQPCEQAGTKRSTIVRIRCCGRHAAQAKHMDEDLAAAPSIPTSELAHILTVSEVSTCAYAMSVCSPIGCMLPRLWEEESQECSVLDDRENEGTAEGAKRKDRWTIRRESNDNDEEKKISDDDYGVDIDNLGTVQSTTKSRSEAGGIGGIQEKQATQGASPGHQKRNAGNKRMHISETERINLREQVRGMFYHGYNAYMENAFPLDELKPLSCRGERFGLTAGNMLTLIDSLDMLAIVGNYTEFARAVRVVSSHADFDLDQTVSVFETTIRILGGLLSAHLLASDPDLAIMPDYDGDLLRLARDLGDRLLPAFETTTSIPYGTVNLRHGVPRGETTEACTAAAGSLSLEFGLLSVLTDDARYGVAARDALKAIFDHRSKLDLVGRHIDVQTGRWTEPTAGIGSNIDSLYEYYIKHYIAFGDEEAFVMFQKLYAAAVRRLRVGDTWYIEVNMHRGSTLRRQFNNLQAFWPGMQTLVGDAEAASRTINAFLRVWNEFGFTPEDFGIDRWEPLVGGTRRGYPLRPELAESVFYMSTTTQDPAWLVAGRDMVRGLEQACFVECGYASIKDIKTERLHDTMPSFFLSELLKYLYLLFDEESPFREDNGANYVFSTEAHLIPVRADFQRKAREMGFAFSRKPRSNSARAALREQVKGLWGVPSLTDEAMSSEWMCPAIDRNDQDSSQVSSYYGANPALRKPRRFGYLSKAAKRASRLASGEDAGGSARRSSSEQRDGVDVDIDAADDDNDDTDHGREELGFAGEEEDADAEDFANVQTVRLGPEEDAVYEVQPLQAGFHLYHEFSNSAVTISSLETDLAAIEVMEGEPMHSSFLYVNQKKPGFALRCSIEISTGPGPTCAPRPSPWSTMEHARAPLSRLQAPTACSFSEFGPGAVPQVVEGSVVLAVEPEGCSAAAYPPELVANRVVLVRRGTCMFEQKALFAEKAGALALLIAQNKDEEGLFYMVGMAQDHLFGKAMAALFSSTRAKLPTFMLSKRDGEILYHRIRQQAGRRRNTKQQDRALEEYDDEDVDVDGNDAPESNSDAAKDADDVVHVRIETSRTRLETSGYPWAVWTGQELIGMVLDSWGFSVTKSSPNAWTISLIHQPLASPNAGQVDPLSNSKLL
ncbi:Mannosyl-oligosaccharide alpha-1,2-mannosidase [Hondaea fermentalgiana]|uniref:alpha-1,2-Mannosidase n=1 Tax=Hondaea fermentalgiana TaxID=2315210 RepID=A0A2R5GQI8_9STRA|nr:Mannosyl-oligosaccharide alpha-1,2-mannosidase [Hondaea fermentalgiana]|eukprot:GBG30893.1 Mannosyl-oligosaccharide alpha-1,2-mannosidase [Hondaea fermentalgiana]